MEHYTVALTLDFENKRIAGKETIRLRSAGEPISHLELDADEIVIDSVLISRRSQPFSQSVDQLTARGHLLVSLRKPLMPGKNFILKVAFHGSPGKGLVFRGNQAYTVYSTSHWMVVNHEPKNLATFLLSLTVPTDLVVVGNGENISARKIGRNLVSKWQEIRAIPDFVFGFAVGPFTQASAKVEKTELRYLSAKYNQAHMERLFRSTPKAFKLFESKGGVSYPSPTYSQVLVAGNPEQELGDFTLLPESYGQSLLTDPADEWLLAHELAHQWWGIGIACREWSDFWLNEGVASFMADVFLGEQYGPARYQHEIEIAQKAYEGLKDSGKDHPLCYLGRKENEVGGRLPYVKGAWVLHLLKQQLGEEVFWRGFKDYTQANWGKTVTSRDLQFSMEKAAGQHLDTFFDQWVYR